MLRTRKLQSPRFSSLPIQPELGILGRKRALIVLAGIGFRGQDGFTKILRSNLSLTPRVLSRRLRELNEAQIISRREIKKRQPATASWVLTEKGRDLLPVIIRLVAYTARWNNNYRFEGRMPGPLAQRAK